jgi:hypothetical protein
VSGALPLAAYARPLYSEYSRRYCMDCWPEGNVRIEPEPAYIADLVRR